MNMYSLLMFLFLGGVCIAPLEAARGVVPQASPASPLRVNDGDDWSDDSDDEAYTWKLDNWHADEISFESFKEAMGDAKGEDLPQILRTLLQTIPDGGLQRVRVIRKLRHATVKVLPQLDIPRKFSKNSESIEALRDYLEGDGNKLDFYRLDKLRYKFQNKFQDTKPMKDKIQNRELPSDEEIKSLPDNHLLACLHELILLASQDVRNGRNAESKERVSCCVRMLKDRFDASESVFNKEACLALYRLIEERKDLIEKENDLGLGELKKKLRSFCSIELIVANCLERKGLSDEELVTLSTRQKAEIYVWLSEENYDLKLRGVNLLDSNLAQLAKALHPEITQSNKHDLRLLYDYLVDVEKTLPSDIEVMKNKLRDLFGEKAEATVQEAASEEEAETAAQKAAPAPPPPPSMTRSSSSAAVNKFAPNLGTSNLAAKLLERSRSLSQVTSSVKGVNSESNVKATSDGKANGLMMAVLRRIGGTANTTQTSTPLQDSTSAADKSADVTSNKIGRAHV